MSARQRQWLFILFSAIVVLVAIGAVYAPGLGGPFVYDDRQALIDNPFTRHLWPLTRAMATPKDTPVSGRPLVALTFAVNYAISGLNEWSYHLFNMILHGACALLLMGLVRGTLRRTALRAWAAPLALFSALLWALHPLNTETVQYTIQRTELMVALFYLGTLYCFMRGLGRRAIPAHGLAAPLRRVRWAWSARK